MKQCSVNIGLHYSISALMLRDGLKCCTIVVSTKPAVTYPVRDAGEQHCLQQVVRQFLQQSNRVASTPCMAIEVLQGTCKQMLWEIWHTKE